MDIRFNSKTPEFAWLSNFSPHSVGLQPTAEHAYQASKSPDPKDWEHVRTLPTAAKAKQWGKETTPPPNWSIVKRYVMEKVLRRKFTDHPELKWALIGTHPHRLVHLAPWDTYWGENEAGVGFNRMGEILMELRDELRAAALD